MIFFDKATSTGRISGADGNRYDFAQQDLKQPVQPAVGTDVDFEPRDGTARDIYVLGNGSTSGNGTYAGEVEPDLGFFGLGWRAATTKYVTFSGRARRKEFWGFLFFYVVILTVAGIVFISVGMNMGNDTAPVVLGLLGLVVLGGALPAWAVQFRRLHDLGQPGWILFILLVVGLIPYVGWVVNFIALIVLGAIEGQPHENKYGVPVKRAA
ncbi:DUF805 domain-containing protein [Cereibacter sphaeroides]|uniref:DUF805 domain-containing protein n=1 Tax=Cereibacter sphaeroides TaxID=1063 RepID=UPI001F167E11|nr:DUF805 domain-containing protein [Cereibacter sphaeroides]MCE6958354.1 DUF805 domain-containing protein [Cereibacter sphaeroides]MCE6972221.1 DUF805 domain-containing protein [Cereibacter sphaeroides]